METEVSNQYYIGLDMVDGTILYFNNNTKGVYWTTHRSQASYWHFKGSAEKALVDLLVREVVPFNARIVKIIVTVEEAK
jgi:hypothetical protein